MPVPRSILSCSPLTLIEGRPSGELVFSDCRCVGMPGRHAYHALSGSPIGIARSVLVCLHCDSRARPPRGRDRLSRSEPSKDRWKCHMPQRTFRSSYFAARNYGRVRIITNCVRIFCLVWAGETLTAVMARRNDNFYRDRANMLLMLLKLDENRKFENLEPVLAAALHAHPHACGQPGGRRMWISRMIFAIRGMLTRKPS